ncbi:MAG: hypothetical protein HY983_01255 [Candidatus Magasanikbacteria bacterium]|nr:hypothetical protein [Candidatus Magasanikbacteria bacterium]
MIKKIKYWLAMVALLLPLAPLTAFAAYNDVTTDGTANIVLPSNSLSYKILSTSKAVYYKVNADGGSVDLSMDNGSLVELTSADKSSFTISNYGTCSISTSCGGESYAYVSCTGAQVVTVTMGAANTCSGGSTGGSTSGGSGGGGGGGATTPVAVAVTTPAPAPQPVVVVEEKPESGITFSGTPSAGLQPGDKMSFGYVYTHAGATMDVKIVRQILNSKGKTIRTSVLVVRKLAEGKVFSGQPVETILRGWAPGEYTMRVQVFNNRNLKTKLAENSFTFTVEKLKQKTFVKGDVTDSSSVLAFDPAGIEKIKTGVKLPTSFRLPYTYTNTTDKSQVIRMVRELVDGSGKVRTSSAGRWTMKPGEKDKSNPLQTISSSLSAGEYQVRIRALDFKTKEVLAENGVHFSVELR